MGDRRMRWKGAFYGGTGVMEGPCAVARGKDTNKRKEGRRERRRREEGVAPGQENSSKSELHVSRKPRAARTKGP